MTAGRKGISPIVLAMIVLAIGGLVGAATLSTLGDTASNVLGFGDTSVDESRPGTEDVIGGGSCAAQDAYSCVERSVGCDSEGYRETAVYSCDTEGVVCCYQRSCDTLDSANCRKTEGCSWNFEQSTCEQDTAPDPGQDPGQQCQADGGFCTTNSECVRFGGTTEARDCGTGFRCCFIDSGDGGDGGSDPSTCQERAQADDRASTVQKIAPSNQDSATADASFTGVIEQGYDQWTPGDMTLVALSPQCDVYFELTNGFGQGTNEDGQYIRFTSLDVTNTADEYFDPQDSQIRENLEWQTFDDQGMVVAAWQGSPYDGNGDLKRDEAIYFGYFTPGSVYQE